MLARNSVRELRVRPIRTALTVAGVAVSTAMLADMLMLGGGIQQSFGELLESRGYELRVSPKGTLPFDTEATIPGWGTLRDSVE
ncbi:MAG: ABC transporter permease, partial [Gemmatimonadetes bacterium]|nr:ABC transporter permease [Gemmatimonadota bacterium]MYK67030.1 ABC transporter permease [Gemmatimonadota bacterium]